MEQSEPLLKFSDIDIYYNRVFDLGHAINPIDAVRYILRSEYGQAALNYQTGTFEVADAYKPLVEGYRKIEELERAYQETIAHPGLHTYLNLLRLSPLRFGAAYVDAIRRAFSQTDETEQEESDKDTVEVASHSPLDGVKQRLAEPLGDLLPLLAIHGYVDREILSSVFLDEVPFARVSLRPFGATIRGQSILFDVTLTIHRAGVAILTAYGGFSGPCKPTDVIQLQQASTLPVEDCEIPAAIMRRYGALYAKEHRERVPSYPHEKSGYVRFGADNSGFLGDILDFYMFTVIDQVNQRRFYSLRDIGENQRDSTWFAYPIVFVRETEPKYPMGAEFKKAHTKDLAQLILGFQGQSALKPEVVSDICSRDLSIVEGYSFHMTEGSSTVIFFDGDGLGVPPEHADTEWMRRKFHTTVVVDLILMQKAILSAFTTELTGITANVTSLVRLKQQYILALQELEALGLSQYGTVHDIIKYGHKAFRIDDLRRLFATKVEGIENLIRGLEEDRRLQRERIVKGLASVTAIAFLLSPVRELVSVLGGFPSTAPAYVPASLAVGYGWLISQFQQHPLRATLVLYSLAVGISLLILWLDTLNRGFRRGRVIQDTKMPKTPQATRSPIDFTVKPFQEAGRESRDTIVGRDVQHEATSDE